MQTIKQRLLYEELELISHCSNQKSSLIQRLHQTLHAIGRWAIEVLIPSSDPHIWSQTDSAGRPYWQMHDPTTGQTAQFDSEDALRHWLETRYYR